MIKEIHPINDCVVVEPIEESTRKVEGTDKVIHLPDLYKDKPQKGKVVAIGPGKMYDGGYNYYHNTWGGKEAYVKHPEQRLRLHPQLKVGDVVLYGRYAGNEVELADGLSKSKKVVIMREADLLGVETE